MRFVKYGLVGALMCALLACSKDDANPVLQGVGSVANKECAERTGASGVCTAVVDEAVQRLGKCAKFSFDPMEATKCLANVVPKNASDEPQ